MGIFQRRRITNINAWFRKKKLSVKLYRLTILIKYTDSDIPKEGTIHNVGHFLRVKNNELMTPERTSGTSKVALEKVVKFAYSGFSCDDDNDGVCHGSSQQTAGNNLAVIQHRKLTKILIAIQHQVGPMVNIMI